MGKLHKRKKGKGAEGQRKIHHEGHEKHEEKTKEKLATD